MKFEFDHFIKLAISILLCEMAGVFGSYLIVPAIPTWYTSLIKPWFSPPNWLFGPVWLVLYALMGISLYIVWDKALKHHGVKKAIYVFDLQIFIVQLFLNAFWTFLFFGLKSLLFAFAEIILLWISITVTIYKFHKISRAAAWILLPYLLWVSFAMVLNYFVWILNM